uniref:Uncharacterized protein n=1 Tax=Quercus lobata TaxID=97700 RepID=A0A7N2ML01_QUELO
MDENVKKLTEARDVKELSGVVIIKQINSPTLPWARDPSKRRLIVMKQPRAPSPPPPRSPGNPGHTPLP